MENNDNTNQTLSNSLCTSGCGFFGNPQFDGMCSQCYKESVKRKQAAPTPDTSSRASSVSPSSTVFSVETASPTIPTLPTAAPSTADEQDAAPVGASASTPSDDVASPATPDGSQGKTKKRNRCTSCRKKVGLTGFECRCGGLYCSLHRYSDKHECQFDYKKEGEDMIRKNNPIIVGAKLQKI